MWFKKRTVSGGAEMLDLNTISEILKRYGDDLQRPVRGFDMGGRGYYSASGTVRVRRYWARNLRTLLWSESQMEGLLSLTIGAL